MCSRANLSQANNFHYKQTADDMSITFFHQILQYRSLKRVTLSLFLLSLNVEVLSFIVGCMSHTCCGNHVIEDE